MKPIRTTQPLDEAEADKARHDGCKHYSTCLDSNPGYWVCSPDCRHYLHPSKRSAHWEDFEGAILLVSAIFNIGQEQ